MLERKSPFVCSVNGAKEISIENYGSLGDFSDKKIVIPSSVVSIENYAFANCKNLKTIEIRTTKLKNKKISSKAFKKINKKVVIRVLKKQRKAYKTLLRKKGLSKANKFKAL